MVSVAPLVKNSWLLTPLCVAVPAMLSVRPIRLWLKPVMFSAAADGIVVAPVPLIVPEVQFITVGTVRFPLPLIVPPLSVKFAVFTVISTATVNVALGMAIVPIPLKLVPAFNVKTALAKLIVAPAEALNPPLLVPPLERLSVPVCAVIVPVLLSIPVWAMLPVPVPADFWNVPALLTVEATPPPM